MHKFYRYLKPPATPVDTAGTSISRRGLLMVATGGGLLFGGDTGGRFKALDQTTGDVLWEVNLGSPVTGFPITYAVDGAEIPRPRS